MFNQSTYVITSSFPLGTFPAPFSAILKGKIDLNLEINLKRKEMLTTK